MTNIGFITGTVRSGTTLLSRCIADHPFAISYRELQLSRIVFCRELNRHIRNVLSNGFSTEEMKFLSSKLEIFNPSSMETWLRLSLPTAKTIFKRERVDAVVEKDPDFSLETEAIDWALNSGHKIIHTLRHPCALRNVPNAPWGEKAVNEAIIGFQNIMRHINNPNLLIIKYEDMTSNPSIIINKVYKHLGLSEDYSFLNRDSHELDSKRWWFYPNITSSIDSSKNLEWVTKLPVEVAESVLQRKDVKEFIEMAGYE